MRLPRVNKIKRLNQTMHRHELEVLEQMCSELYKVNILKELRKKNIYYM
jgi:hypothetical protein